jgi:hypothetical protein
MIFKTPFVQKEIDKWYEAISSKLLDQGQVSVDELDGPPRGHRSRILKGYIEEHSDFALEYRERESVLAFQNSLAVESVQMAWQEFLTSKNVSNRSSQVETIVEILNESLGGTEEYQRDACSFGRLWSACLDSSSAFETLNLASRLPVVFHSLPLLHDQDVNDIRHLLTYQSSDPSRLCLVIMPGNHEEISQAHELLKEKFQPFAIDGIAISIDQIIRIIASKRPYRRLRRLVVSNINLKTISPFVVQAPVSDLVFVGRESEMREVSEHASNASYSIIGGRRIGKTSILHQLHRARLPLVGFRTIYHDCSTTPSYEDFLETDIRSWQPMPPSKGLYTFQDLIQSPPTDKPLALLLDEVDKLIPVDRSNGWVFFNTLRSMANTGQAQSVLSGERTLRDALRDPESPLFNFANEILIGPLDYRAVEELVTRPMKQLEVELIDEKAIVDHIWAFTSGHPNVVQRLCHRLIEQLNEQNTRRITLKDVSAITEDPGFQRNDFLSTYWEAATSLEKIISLLMSDNEEVRTLQSLRQVLEDRCGLQPSAREIDDALQRLVDLRSILKRTPTGYEFAVKAFPRVVAGTMTLNDMLMILTEEYEEQGE